MNKFETMSDEQLLKHLKWYPQRAFHLILLASLFIFFGPKIFRSPSWSILWLGLLVFIVICYFRYFRELFARNKAFNTMFGEARRLDRYQFALEHLVYLTKSQKTALQISRAQLAVLTGDFARAKDLYERIEIKKMKFLFKKPVFLLNYYLHKAELAALTGEDYDLTAIQTAAAAIPIKDSKLKQHKILTLENIKMFAAIARGEDYQKPDDLPQLPRTKLSQIRGDYYAGRLALIRGDKKKASEALNKIAEENKDLFVVRDARDWLESQDDTGMYL